MSQSHLQEFRRIRAEQDAEYERMLAIDSVSTLLIYYCVCIKSYRLLFWLKNH